MRSFSLIFGVHRRRVPWPSLGWPVLFRPALSSSSSTHTHTTTHTTPQTAGCWALLFLARGILRRGGACSCYILFRYLESSRREWASIKPSPCSCCVLLVMSRDRTIASQITDMPSLTKSVFQGLASFGLSRMWHHKFGLSSAETQHKRPYLHSMTKEHGRECSRVRKIVAYTKWPKREDWRRAG